MVHFSECSTIAANCNTETQIEMRDGTVEQFPVAASVQDLAASEAASRVAAVVAVDAPPEAA